MSATHKSLLTPETIPCAVNKSVKKQAQRARRQVFVAAFLSNGGNAAAAARSATGCSGSSSRTIGKRLLQHPDVIELLDKHYANIAAQGVLSMGEKRQILKEIATDQRHPATARISAILADSDLSGERAPTKSQTLNVTATIGPDGQPTMPDPFAAIAPRLDAWRKLQKLRRPPDQIPQYNPDKMGQVPAEVNPAGNEQLDKSAQDEQTDTTAMDVS